MAPWPSFDDNGWALSMASPNSRALSPMAELRRQWLGFVHGFTQQSSSVPNGSMAELRRLRLGFVHGFTQQSSSVPNGRASTTMAGLCPWHPTIELCPQWPLQRQWLGSVPNGRASTTMAGRCPRLHPTVELCPQWPLQRQWLGSVPGTQRSSSVPNSRSNGNGLALSLASTVELCPQWPLQRQWLGSVPGFNSRALSPIAAPTAMAWLCPWLQQLSSVPNGRSNDNGWALPPATGCAPIRNRSAAHGSFFRQITVIHEKTLAGLPVGRYTGGIA
jgi:hypothetical protein